MADSLLVLVPQKSWYYISILIKRTKTAANVGKMRAVKNKMPSLGDEVYPPMLWSPTKCSGGEAGGWLVWQAYLAYPAQLAKHESPCGMASAAAAWKWASESQNMAQFSIEWGAETKQSMCRAWLP